MIVALKLYDVTTQMARAVMVDFIHAAFFPLIMSFLAAYCIFVLSLLCSFLEQKKGAKIGEKSRREERESHLFFNLPRSNNLCQNGEKVSLRSTWYAKLWRESTAAQQKFDFSWFFDMHTYFFYQQKKEIRKVGKSA